MKRLRPAYTQSRDGQTTIQRHEDERGKPPGNVTSAVAPGLAYLVANHALTVDPHAVIPAPLAGKLAVVETLIGMVAYDVQLRPLLLGERQQAARIETRPRGIFIDWPESGTDVGPVKFTVRDAAPWKYDGLGLSGPDMDKDTADVYGAGTVLLHRHDCTGTVLVETVCSTTSSRDALVAALTSRFGVEPRDFRTGRRVTLKCYYDRMVRMTLADEPFSYDVDPTGEKAKANEFPLTCFLTVEVPDVTLVEHPGWFETPPTPRMP